MTKAQVINAFNARFTPKLGIRQHSKEGAIAAYLDKASRPTPATSTPPALKPTTKPEFALVYDTCTGDLSAPSGRRRTCQDIERKRWSDGDTPSGDCRGGSEDTGRTRPSEGRPPLDRRGSVLSVARSFSGVYLQFKSLLVQPAYPDPNKTLAPLSLARECPARGSLFFCALTYPPSAVSRGECLSPSRILPYLRAPAGGCPLRGHFLPVSRHVPSSAVSRGGSPSLGLILSVSWQIPLLAPAGGCPLRGRFLSDSTNARSPTHSSASTPLQASPSSGLLHLLPLLRHTPQAPKPRVLQQWLLSPASRLDAGSALGHGERSAHDRQRSFSPVHVNAHRAQLPSHPCRRSQPCEQALEGHGTQVRWPLLTTPPSFLQAF